MLRVGAVPLISTPLASGSSRAGASRHLCKLLAGCLKRPLMLSPKFSVDYPPEGLGAIRSESKGAGNHKLGFTPSVEGLRLKT